ncbi:putative S-methyl-5'-thioadenosine phosphorylase [Microcystis aeruginosa PCC 9432]|jgi:5'-methylthioadenosine phosphorylase|uniref:S-methyl-5'-thioadenosine phosphorylase n=2 Tax=Microcystis aeruginosa TaxID=1126 RepID=A0A2H6BUP6_MICAE|nr:MULTISPECIES: S-methyl-5'-thioadenosine phosphorylase [Microcystis]TRT96532.1 MAG: S-methyl-5'-thioadenosine phosphorylase [Microcystis aeruginosa Ma_OC_LR_19540900_S633]MCZ8243504.1 S-methyl-5'-thioadenosine phosphorylase [Microcystis sp. LE19-131.1A]QHU83423.1 S-methyl-5'-thioadenosine phosphorylase [Microcystis aeruginosa NIES-298]CCH95485.1 putative S-methyl-5'-thioadenosine phosphorylase [Microcystis aeruginosa PCC 9432]GBD53907.1 5'-methylthioadenosine phosphorylase [Microcystis aerug
MTTVKIGIIGGSGLYKMDALKDVREVSLDTPFGSPSDALILGTLEGTEVAFLARHGRGHHFLPTELPFRANIHALKQLGVEYIISASAVGSLKAEVKPLDLVIPDQFIDRTKERIATFFGEGIVAHVAFGDPICPQLAEILGDAVASLNLPEVTLHRGGTYICMEGPAFSTKAESNLYRSWGATVIGMTNLTEAKLAREAEIAYATLALVTDYDCWHPDHDHVTVEMVIENLHHNAINAQKVIQETVRRLAANPPVSAAHSALKYAILTRLDSVPVATKEKLALFLKKYEEVEK